MFRLFVRRGRVIQNCTAKIFSFFLFLMNIVELSVLESIWSNTCFYRCCNKIKNIYSEGGKVRKSVSKMGRDVERNWSIKAWLDEQQWLGSFIRQKVFESKHHCLIGWNDNDLVLIRRKKCFNAYYWADLFLFSEATPFLSSSFFLLERLVVSSCDKRTILCQPMVTDEQQACLFLMPLKAFHRSLPNATGK